MGVHGLLKYVHKYGVNVSLPQTIQNNKIYISNIVYYDFTSKLIDFYNNYCTLDTFDEIVNGIINDMKTLFEYILNYNNKLYVFIDYKIISSIDNSNILFKDFILTTDDFDEYEREQATPMIKMSHITNSLDYILNKVKCKFELKRTKHPSDYIELSSVYDNVYECVKNDNALSIDDVKNILDDYTWYRYLILRGAKRITFNNRVKQLTENGDLDHKVSFSKVLRHADTIVKLFNEKYPTLSKRISFFGCSTESDFSITKHINTYNKFSYVTIYTNDTDMLVTLCDVDCIIKLNIENRNTRNKQSKYHDKNISINPIKFWNSIFKCDLSPRMIKLLCILMGTDYNHYDRKSPIHIQSFDEILNRIHVKDYKDIDEDDLLLKIYDVMSKNKNNIYVKQTAVAINMYLNDIEYRLLPI